MQLRILGSLDVTDDLGATIAVPGVRRRTLLVRLLVDVNRVVSVERLISDLWEGHPPSAAPVTLQSHISHLRKLVGAGRVLNRSGGYVFLLGDARLDLIDFQADLAAGRQLLAAGRSPEAVVALERALCHWRGPALADVAEAQWSRPEVVRLEEMRLDAVDLGLEARLAAGQSAEVVALAEAAVVEHPLRENLWAHLIAALYRQGRQAEALEAFQRLRHCLVEDLGLEPSLRLVELEQAVLRHQPGLDTPAAPTDPVELVDVDRWRQPGTTANRVLVTAAIIGEVFTVPFLAQLADLPEGTILDVLDGARESGLVYDAGHHFEFVDPVVLRALHDQTGPTRRAVVHRRVAGLLGTTPDSIMEEARHWLAGGRAEDLPVVRRCLGYAMQRALDDVGPRGAATWLEDMLDVIEAERDPQDPMREQLLLALTSAHRPADLTNDWSGVDHSPRATNDPTVVLDALVSSIDVLLTSNRSLLGPAPAPPELLAVACLAMVRLAEQSPASAARRLANLAQELTWTNAVEDRLLVGRQAVELAGSARDPATLVTVVVLAYPAMAVPSTLGWRLDLTAEALAVADQSGRPMLRFLAAFARLQCVIEVGDRQEIDDLVDLLDLIAGESDEALCAWVATMCRGWRQLVSGDLRSAGRSIAAFRELGTRLGQPETAVACYKLRLAMARHEGTADPRSQAGRIRSSTLLPLESPQCYAAYQHLDRGDYGAAIHLLQGEAKRQFSTRSTPNWLPTQLMWAEVALRLRAAAPALQLYDQLLPYAAHLHIGPLTTSEGSVAEYLGALAGLLGRFDDADRHYSEAIALLRRVRAPFHLARAEVAWARLLGGRGQPSRSDQARALLIDAVAIADRHGCHGVDRAARRELLEHSLRQDGLAVAGR